MGLHKHRIMRYTHDCCCCCVITMLNPTSYKSYYEDYTNTEALDVSFSTLFIFSLFFFLFLFYFFYFYFSPRHIIVGRLFK